MELLKEVQDRLALDVDEEKTTISPTPRSPVLGLKRYWKPCSGGRPGNAHRIRRHSGRDVRDRVGRSWHCVEAGVVYGPGGEIYCETRAAAAYTNC
jgi:hypothetical protein